MLGSVKLISRVSRMDSGDSAHRLAQLVFLSSFYGPSLLEDRDFLSAPLWGM